MIKIDVTGFECQVLAGGSHALLHKLRPRLIVVNVQHPASEACVRALAEKHRFEVLHSLPEPALADGAAVKASRGKHLVLTDRNPRERAAPTA